jgi:hypothetical protein
MMTQPQRAKVIWPLLLLAARMQRVLTYREVEGFTGFPAVSQGESIHLIYLYCKRKGYPQLNSIVVNQGTGFSMATAVGRERRRRENRRRMRSRHQEQGEVSSASCVRVRRKRDYGNRAKSEDQITMGTVGACRKKGYAIHSRRPVRGCGSGRESDLVPQTGPREGRDGYGSPRRRGEPLMRHLTRGAAFFRGD